MKKIVLINYTLNFGGAERFISGLANFLSEYGYNVSIILLDKSSARYNINNSIEVFYPGFIRPSKRTVKIIYFFRLFIYLRKKVKSINPETVVNTAFPTFVLAAIGKMKPTIISIRCNPANTAMIEGLNMPLPFRNLFYKRAKSIIAQTDYAARILKKQFGHENICIIPNFLSTLKYDDLRREKQILFVGRLVKSKGVDFLINAFSFINNKEWKLVIVGDGPERESLENLAANFDCNTRINFAGIQSDINFFYQSSEIFAFPSFTEGFPNALLEAMAAPLACISFNCKAGPGDIIENGVNGILVETGNFTDFSAKLNDLMSNHDKREAYKKEAIKVRSKFHINKIGARYVNLILE